MLKKYKMNFEIWGLLLFLIVMLPNFIWFSIPAPNDILRSNSITETIDTIASICQVLMVVALCAFKNRDASKLCVTPFFDYFGRLLLIIFYKLDILLCRHSQCGCCFRVDYSSVFGVFILCH